MARFDLESSLKKALADALGDECPGLLDSLCEDTNLFEALDSFLVVSILLETESVLERDLSRYVALADESVFDSVRSPLLKWSDWIDFVRSKYES